MAAKVASLFKILMEYLNDHWCGHEEARLCFLVLLAVS